MFTSYDSYEALLQKPHVYSNSHEITSQHHNLFNLFEQKMKTILVLKLICIAFYPLLLFTNFGLVEGQNGKWQLLLNSTGVVPMHMQLTHQNTVIMYDQTSNGPSSYPLKHRSNGTRCTKNNNDQSDSSCYAHSIEYDVSTNHIRPLNVESDLWCSSGALLSNGTLVQTGGYRNGARRIRYINPCQDQTCDWRQSRVSLFDDRWYASNQILPEDDRVIVVGGRKIFTYEFVPKFYSDLKAYKLPFLQKTYEGEDWGLNLYPFLHLSSDGKLFIFANRDSILFDYKENKVVKKFPKMPGGGARNYPNTGSSVMLPLRYNNLFTKVEVMVCGGGAKGAFRAARGGKHLEGLRTCGRMVITEEKPEWKMENMPEPRLLNDMIILPTGHILIINGAKNGCGGYNNGANPSLHPYLYKPEEKPKDRFSILESTKIPRMYHSSAILLPDGRVLVAGGNPHNRYMFENVAYPTELRLQAFVPHHMNRKFDHIRPRNVSVYAKSGGEDVEYGEEFGVRFQLARRADKDDLTFSMYAPPFNTHSNSMNQRMLFLRCRSLVWEEKRWVRALVDGPPWANVAPPGYYLLTVVNKGIPSVSQWVKFIRS